MHVWNAVELSSLRIWAWRIRPQLHGGAELGIAEATIMMETIAESGAGIAGSQTIHAKWDDSEFTVRMI